MVVKSYISSRISYLLFVILWHVLVDAITFGVGHLSGVSVLATSLTFLLWDIVAFAYIWAHRPSRRLA